MWYIFCIVVKTLVVIAILALFLTGRPCVAKDKSGNSHAGKQVPSQNQPVIPVSSTVVNPPLTAPCTQEKPCYTQDESSETPLPRWRRPEWVIVYVTIAYSFITWLTLKAIKRQANLMADQLRDARADSVESAKTTQATLAAIQRQAKAMETQASHMASQIAEARAQVALLAQQNRDGRDRQRARLIIQNLEMPELLPPHPILNGGRAFKVRAVVENLGGSRAFNVRAWGTATVAPDRDGDSYDIGFRQRFPFIIDADQHKHLLTVTGMGQEHQGVGTTGDYYAIPEELAQRIRNADVFIVASGMLVYEDIFLDTYETPFHFVWCPFGNDDGGTWLTESYWLDRSPRPRRVIAGKKQEDQPHNPN